MVLQHARSYSQPSRSHPDPARIVGMAGTIALNIALLMLLLVPMAVQLPEIDSGPPPYVIPFEKTLPPTPPPPIEKVEIVQPRDATPQALATPEIQPVTPDPVIVEDGTLPATSIAEQAVAPSHGEIAVSSETMASVRLEYARAPSPPYPRDALLSGLQGVVMLQILVDTNGRPLEVNIHKSSGHRELDEAARRFVLKNWTFRPAMKDGRAVQAIGIVPIDFNLGR